MNHPQSYVMNGTVGSIVVRFDHFMTDENATHLLVEAEYAFGPVSDEINILSVRYLDGREYKNWAAIKGHLENEVWDHLPE